MSEGDGTMIYCYFWKYPAKMVIVYVSNVAAVNNVEPI